MTQGQKSQRLAIELISMLLNCPFLASLEPRNRPSCRFQVALALRPVISFPESLPANSELLGSLHKWTFGIALGKSEIYQDRKREQRLVKLSKANRQGNMTELFKRVSQKPNKRLL